MPYSAFKLLSKIYVYKHFNLKDSRRTSFLNDLFNNEDFLYETNLLIQYGIFRNLNVVGDGVKVEESRIFESIMKIFFKKEDLTPEMLELRIWVQHVGLLSNLASSKNNTIVNSILTKHSIQNKLQVDINIELNPLNLLGIYNKILVILDEYKLPEKTIKQIYKLSKYIPVIKIRLNENIIDQLPEINSDLIYLENGNIDSELNFVKYIKNN